jgi:hypothetical protein
LGNCRLTLAIWQWPQTNCAPSVGCTDAADSTGRTAECNRTSSQDAIIHDSGGRIRPLVTTSLHYSANTATTVEANSAATGSEAVSCGIVAS